jgi:hypothetical protein
MLEVPAHGGQHAAVGATDVPREGLAPLVRAQADTPALAIDSQVFAAPVPIRELAEINKTKNEPPLSSQNHVLERNADTAFAGHSPASDGLCE